MTRKVLETCAAARFFPKNGSVLAAVSGGADSMALLTFLCSNREALSLSRVTAAHFNHGLRETALRDELFVREQCAALGIACVTGGADVRAEAERAGRGIEDTARRLRYAFLQQAAKQNGCHRIATGHTADDNAETMLLNLVRGAGLRGMGGIAPVRGIIVRPLLTCSRAEIEAYLAERGVSHITDESNEDLHFRRNYIRHALMPQFKALNPRFPEAALRMAQTLRADEEYLTEQAERTADGTRETPEGCALEACLLAALHPALASRVVRLLYARAGGQEQALTQAHIAQMLALCGEDCAPGAQTALPGGLVARRVYTDWVVGAAFAVSEITPAVLRPGVSLTLPEQGVVIRCRAMQPSEKIHNSFNSFTIASDTIKGDLVVRSRKPGDKLSQPGRNGAKSLKKLLIECKIPQHKRPGVAVLSDDAGVAAVMGFGPDARCAADCADGAWEISAGGLHSAE